MRVILLLALLLVVPFTTYAQSFEEKSIDEFLTLKDFSSVGEFEEYIGDYVQNCLDHSYGGSLAVRCFINYEIWDRELNFYYQLLYRNLSDDGKSTLKNSQISWLKTRDNSIAFNRLLLNGRYEDKIGTMYIAMRAGDASEAISPIIKQRALLLKSWLEYQRAN
ncbi:lysozyme inhibitor LprI family protein [Shewanella gaetbuli]|uniref:Lysozyme inhibitor LprI family protein n=1 Tax=Shewanella gaetbuli TaxID=220752 RepID=A0A9X2CH89_9GAMM|nr:lysozyme inhibitor LprI family protein [Shewanella gaetbuli]MCL1143238.1 lysozyme inhibitor LprI family protein [Shewanella gaetbuli]